MVGHDFLRAAVAACVFGCGVPECSADIVKFVDEDGVLNFTDRASPGRHEVFLRVRAHSPLPSTMLYEANRSRYTPLIHAAAAEHGLDPRFITCVIEAESGFNPAAVSRAGARGLMQLMPSTAMYYQVDNPFDPEANIHCGTRHLKSLLKKYRGNMKLALAAYNAGEDAVAKYNGVPPFRETREYVSKILRNYNRPSAFADDAAAKVRIYRYVSGDGSILLTDTPRAGKDVH